MKEIRKKLRTKKKKIVKKSNNLYDIDNFVIQNNVKKIDQRKQFLNIPIPVFNELNYDYYNEEIESESVYNFNLGRYQ